MKTMMQKHFFILSSMLLLISSFSNAQSGFQKIFGGIDDESAFSIKQTLNGGFIMTGNSQSYGINNGLDDILLLKTDSLGTMEWARVYGDSLVENGACVRQSTDSSYWITGRTYSGGFGSADVFLLHTDQSGNLLFYKIFGDSLYEAGQALELTNDKGCVITGGTTSAGNGDLDIFVLKIDSTGQMQWLKIFGSNQFDQGTSIVCISSGGYLIGGRGIENGHMNIVLSRMSDQGVLLWSKSYLGNVYDESYAITESANHEFLVSGSSLSYGNNNGFADFLLIKTDTSGNLLKARTFGGPEADAAYGVFANRDSGFVVTGYSESYHGLSNNQPFRGSDSANIFVIRVNSNLDTIWSAIYGGTSMDESFSVIQKNDNGFAVAAFEKSFGNDSSRAYLICTNESGQSGCHQLFVSPDITDVIPNSMDNFFNVFSTGFDTASLSIPVFTVFPLDSFLCQPFSTGSFEINHPVSLTWPNPFVDELTISLAPVFNNPPFTVHFYEPTGKLVNTFSFNAYAVKMNLSFLTNGVYFYTIQDNEGVKSYGKVVKFFALK